MSKHRQKLIIIDGPDGVGKSTLINNIVKSSQNTEVLIDFKKTLDGKTPAMIATKSEVAIFETMLLYLDPSKTYILDRGYMSNYVYSVFRGESQETTARYFNDILRLMSMHDVMFTTLVPKSEKTGDYEDNLIALTADAYNEITSLYTELVKRIRSAGMKIDNPICVLDMDSREYWIHLMNKFSKFSKSGVVIGE